MYFSRFTGIVYMKIGLVCFLNIIIARYSDDATLKFYLKYCFVLFYRGLWAAFDLGKGSMPSCDRILYICTRTKGTQWPMLLLLLRMNSPFVLKPVWLIFRTVRLKGRMFSGWRLRISVNTCFRLRIEMICWTGLKSSKRTVKPRER